MLVAEKCHDSEEANSDREVTNIELHTGSNLLHYSAPVYRLLQRLHVILPQAIKYTGPSALIM